MKVSITTKMLLSAALSATAASASAQSAGNVSAAAAPDLVVPPNGINLGSTSFYDGFGPSKPGLTIIQYARYNNFNAIKDSKGDDSASFQNPRIDVLTSVTQFSVATPINFDGNALGFDVLVPVTSIRSRFGEGGLQLRDNGTAFGDVTFGPFIQFKPHMRGPRPVASVRVAFNVIAPTGGFDRRRDLNQGSGYWSLNPYVAWTVLPAPGWEISGRLQYLYNFKTTRIANPPAIPGLTFDNGQAGQMLYSNFDVSREVARGVALGANGFVVKQLNNNRLNGNKLPDTKKSALYIGPGIHYDHGRKWLINANLYLPVAARNYSSGPQANVQLILPIN
ncbi:SphA family protein [Sphingomonas prati]|uniref:Phenol degradation protein meta n=1 Tax=Sphingomonas prati TaxID=1843237 RepID=A0A7W9BVE1_9SPHN|nr:transporter [Sphingomonas prati]MBB5730751.1 hypothetical protein [Sphingomonas prati]GGE96489.1 hypothetical protein GCM10011404_32000 [Sphingomonas prati]